MYKYTLKICSVRFYLSDVIFVRSSGERVLDRRRGCGWWKDVSENRDSSCRRICVTGPDVERRRHRLGPYLTPHGLSVTYGR